MRWFYWGLLVVVPGLFSIVNAATINVTTTIDVLESNDGLCSLREAVIAVNTAQASGGPSGECSAGDGENDTILLETGTYLLEIAGRNEDLGLAGDLDIWRSMSVLGAGAERTVIDGQARSFMTGLGDRVLHIIGDIVVVTADLTITGGTTSGWVTRPPEGCGVRNEGSLSIRRAIIRENFAESAYGAGVGNFGDLEIIDSSIHGNLGGSDSLGGGIYTRGSLVVRRSAIVRNSVQGGGGAVWGDLVLVNSTISSNTTGYYGGGIYGAGVIKNGTIAENNSQNYGVGGIQGEVSLENSIVVGNIGATFDFEGPLDCDAASSLGHNLVGIESGCQVDEPGDIAVDPTMVIGTILSPLEDNAGMTPIHGLPPGSPAIDSGQPSGCVDADLTVLSLDQRGVKRPQDGDADRFAFCDIGAFELEASTLVVVVDIKPDDYPNTVNPRSRGKLPIAILGSPRFNVLDVDVTSLAFGERGAEPAHILSDPFAYDEHLVDVNLDGHTDLMLHFSMWLSGIECGDESATLTGETLDGYAIEGVDSIATVGCGRKMQPAIWIKGEDRLGKPREDTVVRIERE